MDKNKIPGTIIIAIFHLLFSLVYLAIAVGFSLTGATSVVCYLFSIYLFICAAGLYMMKNWGRILAIGLAAFLFLTLVVYVTAGVVSKQTYGGIIFMLILALIPVAILKHLLRPSWRSSTAEKSKDAAPRSIFKNVYLRIAVFLLLIFIWIFWSIGEPGRRADAVYESISPGITAEEVLSLLKGWYYCSYFIELDGNEEKATREDFLETMNEPLGAGNRYGRMGITFMGIAPLRFSFSVRFGPDGKVESLTDPQGWD